MLKYSTGTEKTGQGQELLKQALLLLKMLS